MHVHDLMTSDVVAAGPDTTVGDLLSLMQQKRIHQIPILSNADKNHKGGDLAGVVTLSKIITRELDVSKATAKAILTSSAKLSSDDTIDRAAELIIGSNQRAVPVWDDGLAGILSEYDLMRVLSLEGKAEDVAKPLVYVDEDSGIGKVKELMVHKNISRVGVLRKGRPTDIVGVVGTLDLAKALAPGSGHPHGGGGTSQRGKAGGEIRAQRDRGYLEAVQIDKTPVTNFTHNVTTVDGSEPLNGVSDLLTSNEEVIVKLGASLGIITPKDLLRAYMSNRSVALVQIVGLDKDHDVLDVARVQQKAAQIIQHLARSAELQPMKIYIKAHRKQGLKTKYSVKAELPTSIGKFISNREHGKGDKSYGQLITIVQRALDDLEREARKAQDKFRKPDRAWVSNMRAEKEEGVGLRTRRIRKG